jgi:hypothetical protein
MSMSTDLDALAETITQVVEGDPLTALRGIADAQRRLGELESLAVGAAMPLATWADIGAALGITRQAAQQRFKDHLKTRIIASTKTYKMARSRRDATAVAAAQQHRSELVEEFRQFSRTKKG